jgi:hypothetical protein
VGINAQAERVVHLFEALHVLASRHRMRNLTSDAPGSDSAQAGLQLCLEAARAGGTSGCSGGSSCWWDKWVQWRQLVLVGQVGAALFKKAQPVLPDSLY